MFTVLDGSHRERFTSKIIFGGSDECWQWRAAKTSKGYGNFCISIDGVKKFHSAHRLAYMMWRGEIPEGMMLDHLCRNRSCVNPRHLEPVTNRENTLRGDLSLRQTHCKWGHRWTTGNTLWRGSPPRRRCRECSRLRMYAANYKRHGSGSLPSTPWSCKPY